MQKFVNLLVILQELIPCMHTLLKKQPHEFYNCAIYKFEVSNESWLKIKLFDVYYSYPHKNKSSKSNPVIILMAIRWFKSTFNTESCKSSLNHDYFVQWVCQWFFLGCWRFQPIVKLVITWLTCRNLIVRNRGNHTFWVDININSITHVHFKCAWFAKKCVDQIRFCKSNVVHD